MKARRLHNHIEITSGISGGKPRVGGHRITVQNIVVWHERLGKSVDEIATEYDLSLSDVYAALEYYREHKIDIDVQIEKSLAFAQQLKKQIPSKLIGRINENR